MADDLTALLNAPSPGGVPPITTAGNSPFAEDFDNVQAEVGAVLEDPDRVIKELTSDDKLHTKVLNYLLSRINDSEREMAKFHPRWQANERLIQAYIEADAKESKLEDDNQSGYAPSATDIIIPYAYATNATINTYLMHTFTTRKPYFQVGSFKAESKGAARNQETVLQYQLDYHRFPFQFYRYLNDIGTYGLGVFSINWDVIEKMRTKRVFQGKGSLGEQHAFQEETIVYEGNRIESHDPFMFFPDTRVSMSEVDAKGEFCFFLTIENRMHLMRDGDVFREALDKAPNKPIFDKYDRSLRNRLRADGDDVSDTSARVTNFNSAGGKEKDVIWLHQGTCWIIPKDLGLSNSERPELWWFSIANKERIIEAIRFDADHELHPVNCAEPFGLGYGFGQIGPTDLLAPLQYIISWLFNSHIRNVRTNLNNMWIVDPSKVVVNDLLAPGPGKVIRLKKNAMGMDVRQALQQLPVQDVTRGHLNDAELMLSMGQLLLGINENLMGSPEAGGRKTATEVRAFSQAAVGRLGMTARILSTSQANLRLQMTSNNIQYLSDEFYFTITGQDGMVEHIRAPNLDGDFIYPVSDGSLPMDRIGELDIWKEIFIAATQNEILLQSGFDVIGLFKHMAELGGATDIEKFMPSAQQTPLAQPPNPALSQNISVAPDQAVSDAVTAGNLIPLKGPI